MQRSFAKKDESFIHRYYDETAGKKIQFHFKQLPALSVVLIAGEQSWYGEKPAECFSLDQGIIISIIREMNMKYSGLAVAIAVLMMSACGNKSEQEPSEVTAPPSSTEQASKVDVEQPAPSPAIISQAPVTTEQPATGDPSSVSAKKPEKTESPTVQKPVVPVKPQKQPEAKVAEKPELAINAVKTPVPEKMEIPAKVNGGGKDGVLGREEGLALANKSGCLACHKIETKLVGPAWRDVSKRYQSDPGAKAHLISKVKSGGKGNWTDVTGGIAMPPYSPRVSDGDIEKLVLFILSQ